MVADDRKRHKVTPRGVDKRLRSILETDTDMPSEDKTLDDKVKLFDHFLESGRFHTLYHRAIHDCTRQMDDQDVFTFNSLFL